MNDLVVAWTPFNYFLFPFKRWNGKSTHPVLSKLWIRDRFEIWKKFTYQSIAAQSGEFIYFVACHILAKDITDAVFNEVTRKDKRVNLLYFGTREYNEIMRDIRNCYGNTFAIRVDSDDMYSDDTFQYIREQFPEGEHYGYFKEGYGHCSKTSGLWKYDCCGSGPFYVVKYPPQMYRFDPIEHTYIKNAGAVILEPGHFVVNIHDNNHSTAILPPHFCEEIKYTEKDRVLSRFIHK